MSYSKPDPVGGLDLTCPKCGLHRLQRLARRGFLQRRIYAFFGYYPWECPKCRETVMLKLRYRHNEQRHRRRREVSSES